MDTATLGPGEVFGEEALLGHPCRPATVVALEESSLLRADAAQLAEFFGRNPGLKHLFEQIRERRVAEAIALVLGRGAP